MGTLQHGLKLFRHVIPFQKQSTTTLNLFIYMGVILENGMKKIDSLKYTGERIQMYSIMYVFIVMSYQCCIVYGSDVYIM